MSELSPENPAPAANHRRRGSAPAMLLQVVLIAVGVFLGLAGEEWREDRDNRRAAMETLRRFRVEVEANRDAVLRVKDYHVARHAELNAYFNASAEEKTSVSVSLAGIRPPRFESTAWDLALAAGTLAYIDPDVAFALSRAYGLQGMVNDLGRGVIQAMYLRPPTESGDGFLAVVKLYYDDLSAFEPLLLETYDPLIASLDEALDE